MSGSINVFGLNSVIIEHCDESGRDCYGFEFDTVAGNSIDRIQHFCDRRSAVIAKHLKIDMSKSKNGIYLDSGGDVFLFEMHPFNDKENKSSVIALTSVCRQRHIPLIRRVKLARKGLHRLYDFMNKIKKQKDIYTVLDGFDFYSDSGNWFYPNEW